MTFHIERAHPDQIDALCAIERAAIELFRGHRAWRSYRDVSMPPEVLRSFHPEPSLASAELQGDWHQRSYVLSCVEGHAQEQTLRNVVNGLVGKMA